MRPPLVVTLFTAAAVTTVVGAVLLTDVADQGATPSPSATIRTSPGSQGGTGSAGAGGPEATARVHYRFPVADCEVSYARTHHDYPAADIFADRGCRFVAPAPGRVDEVVGADTWDPATNRGAARGGRSVSIVGADGVRYYGSHLEDVTTGIRSGVAVRAGQTLGLVGDSGSARGTGTHLHFGISWPTPPGRWWIRRGVVAPQPFLDAWQEGRERSPVEAVARARRRYGDDSTCRAYC